MSLNSLWKSFVRHCAQSSIRGIVEELDSGTVVCLTQSALIFTNGVFLSSTVSDELDLLHRLEAVKTYICKLQPTFPWALFIEPELLLSHVCEQSRKTCEIAGFKYTSTVKCMQTESLLPPVRALPVAEINFAGSLEDVYNAVLLNVQAYNMEASAAVNVMECRALMADYEKQICCIVSVDGKSVATATTVFLDEFLYVALVATSAQFRKRGYAEVALRASIEHAFEVSKKKKRKIVLHATELGHPVYERMGFKDISEVDMYIHETVKTA